MPPTLALLLWFVLLLGLLFFDPAKKPRTSLALWVPMTWMFFVGTRMPSQWLGGEVGSLTEAYVEGNPLNRSVFLALTLVALVILILRYFKWEKFFTQNLALMAFLFFGLASVFWSDFPFITIKRWFRDLGGYMAILVVLSDPNPLEAVRTLLRRFSYLVIPLSVVLVKYYPGMGIGYDAWTGLQMYTGATSSKNSLGVACLVSGIYFFWDTAMRWPDRAERRTKRILLVNGAFIWMTLWLMNCAHSATSNVCLVIGSLVILLTASKTFKRHPTFFKALIPASFCLYVILAYWFNANAYLVGAVGRNATLTDRTYIWQSLLSIETNPVVGTGYRSFFLGERLEKFWLTFPGINEAHNGYLDIYLNLGMIGVVLLLLFLVAGYMTIWKRFRFSPPLASLGLAIWTLMLFYNITEAAFDNTLLWLSLILLGIAVPGLSAERARSLAPTETVGMREQLPRFISEPAGLRNKYTSDRPSLDVHSIPARNLLKRM
jgi:exopolysaccharide production protein ExoQ